MVKKAYGKCRKILDAKALNKQTVDFHFKMHDSNEVKQTIRLDDWNISLDISSGKANLNQALTNILSNGNGTNNVTNKMITKIRIINYVDDILLLHQYKEYLKNMTQQVIKKLKYFGFTMITEKRKTKLNRIVIFLVWEWNIAKTTVKTKPKKRLRLLLDLNNMRRWIKTGTEITVKQSAKLIGKLNYLRQQFQEASLMLNIMDHQKTQAAGLRGWNTTMIMNKTAIPDINQMDSET
ncbi:MAG: hypothetical protein EZS28_041634, partial [Streblomastix strix]